jgi:signal peptidase II
MTIDTEPKTNSPSSVFRLPCVAPWAKRGHLLFWPIFIAGVALDLWSKNAVFNWLKDSPQHSFTVIEGFLRLQMAENPGAAFGIAAGQRPLLVAVSVVALAIVFSVFLFAATHRKIVNVALALFAAGVCGNLYDRLFNNGLVRDFIDVVYWPGKHWPAFNVADSLLCIAVGLLILSSFSTRQSSQKRAQPQK